ncbi:hypothetical protein JCM8097_008991 [Rhodosporidiobolus ruineniae]
MPLFLRSHRSKGNLAHPAAPVAPPALPPSLADPPFQLPLPSFVSASSLSDTASSTSTTTPPTSLDMSTPKPPTRSDSGGSGSKWSMVDTPAVHEVPLTRDGDKEKRNRSNSAASAGSRKSFKGFFARRRSRSASKGRPSEGDDNHGGEVEQVPPVPALPPTVDLLSLLPPAVESTAPTPVPTRSAAPEPVDEDDLTALLRLVHAAGDKIGGDPEGTPYEPELHTPPLVSSSSFFSRTSAPSSASPATPKSKPVYSFLSHLPSSGFGEGSKSNPKPSFLSSPPPKPFPSSSRVRSTRAQPVRDDGREDDYGAASDEEEQPAPPQPRSGRKKPTPALPHAPAAAFPPPAQAKRPLGPAATSLLRTSLSRLAPSPPSSSSAPSSTLPRSATPPSSNLRRTLARLSLARRLAHPAGLTAVEALEVESSSSCFVGLSSSGVGGGAEDRSSLARYGADQRASVMSLSAVPGLPVPAGAGAGAGAASEAEELVKSWEAQYGPLSSPSTARRLFSPSAAGGAADDPHPPSGKGIELVFPRLAVWSARPSFARRNLEARVVRAAGVETVVEDVVRPCRVGFGGGTSGLGMSGRVRGLLHALEGGVEEVDGPRRGSDRPSRRTTRTTAPPSGLPNPAGGEEVLPAAFRAAAAGAVSPPRSPSSLGASRPPRDSRMAGGAGGGRGARRPLLGPGPLLLKALAEEAEEDVGASVPVAKEEKEEGSNPDDDDSEEDDRPLFQLKQEAQRASLLPPFVSPPRSRSASPIASRRAVSPVPHPSHAASSTHAALLLAQRRTATLEAELVQLRAREAAASEREKAQRALEGSRADERRRDEREREKRRREEEQRRRGRALEAAGVAGRGRRERGGEEGREKAERRSRGEKRSSTLPSSSSHQHGLQPHHYGQQPYLIPPVNPWMPMPVPMQAFAVPVPVPVPMPLAGQGGFYQLPPAFSGSAADLHGQQQRALSPSPAPMASPPRRAASPAPPRSQPTTPKRHSHLPPAPPAARPGPTPISPPPRPAPTTPKRVSLLPPSRSQPDLKRQSSSPAASSLPPHPPPPTVPRSHSAATLTPRPLHHLTSPPPSKRLSRPPLLSDVYPSASFVAQTAREEKRRTLGQGAAFLSGAADGRRIGQAG